MPVLRSGCGGVVLPGPDVATAPRVRARGAEQLLEGADPRLLADHTGEPPRRSDSAPAATAIAEARSGSPTRTGEPIPAVPGSPRPRRTAGSLAARGPPRATWRSTDRGSGGSGRPPPTAARPERRARRGPRPGSGRGGGRWEPAGRSAPEPRSRARCSPGCGRCGRRRARGPPLWKVGSCQSTARQTQAMTKRKGARAWARTARGRQAPSRTGLRAPPTAPPASNDPVGTHAGTIV